jgi:hypothetical protein
MNDPRNDSRTEPRLPQSATPERGRDEAKPATPPARAEPEADLDLALDEIAPTRRLKEGFTGQER